jgi:phospholipase/carboxylesterase
MKTSEDKLLEYNYIYIPSDNESDVTLLLLHGTGGDERDLLDIGKKLNPHAHLLSPRGNVLEGQHNRFFERLSEGVFNEEDIKKRSYDLSEFIEAAREKHHLKHTKVVAVGFSNGANIAASLLLLYPQILNGAILLRAMLPLTPLEKPDLNNKPILLLSGTNDRMMNESQVKELGELFQSCGAKLTHEWQDTGHNLLPQDIEIATQWLSDNF